MMLFLLYFNIFWCSLAVLCVSINCTASIPSRHKRGFQEDLNEFEIAIHRLLIPHHGSSKKGHSRVIDNSFGNKILNEQVHQDGKSRPGIPTAIDMAFPMQKQRFKNPSDSIFVNELKEDKGRQEKQKQHIDRESTSLDMSGDEEHEDKEKNKYSPKEKVKKPVKDGRDEIKNNKKDSNISVHELRKKNSTAQKDLAIPDAIDLAFTKGQRKSPTRITTAKPTTMFWPPTTTSSPTPNQFCRSKIDLGFLVEASKSVARTGPGNYRRLINFVKHVVLKFAVGPTATRIGVISYANRPILLMGFNDGENIQDVLQFLKLPCHHCWNAQTGLALSFAQSYLYGCSCSLRQRVLVVVTDGSSSDGVHIPSRILKQNGVKIIAVGVGRYFNIHQLNAMASRPAKKNVFTGDFSKIHHVTNELVRQICKGRQNILLITEYAIGKLNILELNSEICQSQYFCPSDFSAADGSMASYSSSPCQCP